MSPLKLDEDSSVEQPAMAVLRKLEWQTYKAYGDKVGPNSYLGRDSLEDVILTRRLRECLARLNPKIPGRALDEAVEQLTKRRENQAPTKANQAVYELLKAGYQASWCDAHGRTKTGLVRYIAFEDVQKNDWLAASQVWIAGKHLKCRPDVILYVNGIPLVLLEFKASEIAVREGYDDNVVRYRRDIPQLFWPNSFILVSNGHEAKVGATYAEWEHFGNWRTADADGERKSVELETALHGVCAPFRLLDYVRNFTAYLDGEGGTVKRVARHHQFFGVQAAMDRYYAITGQDKSQQLGVYWHTQGSGKSMSMLWFTQKLLHEKQGGLTFVMVTDRQELDDQLHKEFARAGATAASPQVHAKSSAHLRELLSGNHRYVFTLIHKFRPDKKAGETEIPVLSERDDIVVITDESHRSQYDTLARNMRKALPNALFMGFTGTPLISGEKQRTREIFGPYVHVYTLKQSKEDGNTVPLFYENRVPRLAITNPDLSSELAGTLDEAAVSGDDEADLVRRFGREYEILTNSDRLRTIASDTIRHFANRGFDGKGMFVALDKATAVRMHDEVQAARQEYLAELHRQLAAEPELGQERLTSRIALLESMDMAVVVSESKDEAARLKKLGLDIAPHRARMKKENLEERFKNPNDNLRLVFVCAMWITGFDVPSASTVYLDRPMRGHTLMQTIARANRVFPGKENGLIVDYIGVFQALQQALAVYADPETNPEGEPAIRDKGELIAELAETLSEVASFCKAHGVDLDSIRRSIYRASNEPFAYLSAMQGATELLLLDEVRKDFLLLADKSRALYRGALPDPATSIHEPTLAVVSKLAQRLRQAFQPSSKDLGPTVDAVDQLLDRSVGVKQHWIDPEGLVVDLSNLDFEALSAEFAQQKRYRINRLAAELLQKARDAARRNPTRYDLVARIEELIKRYNDGIVESDEALREVIDLAERLNAAGRQAKTRDLTEEENAIYDLLTQPGPDLTPEQQEQVKDCARQLVRKLSDVIILDWRVKSSGLAAVRTMIERTLGSHLSEELYPEVMFQMKVDAVYEHVQSAYDDDHGSVYDDIA